MAQTERTSQVGNGCDGCDGCDVDGHRCNPSGGRFRLWVPQASGGHLGIQVPAGLGWSDARLGEFGAGVHLTDDAVQTVG